MTEVAETVPVAPVLEEQRYEYQPTDENNVPMGGVQVVKWTPRFLGDFKGALDAMAENNVRLQRKLREANRKNKTGQFDPEEIPESAPRFTEPVDFIPEDLSAEELIAITQDLTNPAKVREAYRRLSKAEYGATPDKIREALKTSQQSVLDNRIRTEVDKFLMNNPDYYVCTENWNTIYNWMQRFKLDPNEENFTMAFKRLSAADILLTGGGTIPGRGANPESFVAPVTVPEAVVPSAHVQSSVPANLPSYDNADQFGGEISVQPVEIVNFDPSVSAPVQRVSTALNNGNTSAGNPVPPVAGSDIVYVSPNVMDSKGRVTNPSLTYVGLKALDAMPPDEYERRFRSEPGFKEKADKLLAGRKINPNQR